MNNAVVRTPHLIQIGEINRPLGKFKGERISKAVDMECMGNAHFEFGALAKSLRVFEGCVSDWKIQLVDVIQNKEGQSLRVFHYLNDEQFQTYLGYLHQLRKDEIHMEERHHFNERVRTDRPHYSDKYDFWWDIKNNLIWSFDKNFMNRVQEHIHASIKYMNDQKKSQQ